MAIVLCCGANGYWTLRRKANSADSEVPDNYCSAEALLSKAFRGDVQAFREFADRVEGRSAQHVELGGGVHVNNGATDWMSQWRNATPEQRRQMEQELDDKIVAAAKRIEASRVDSPENRYRARIREYQERCEAGENPNDVRATLKTPM